MKNILMKLIIILVILIVPARVSAIATTDAKEPIDLSIDSNLTINYLYEDYNFDNTNVKIYYIASVTSDYVYNLTSSFSGYPIKVNGIKSMDEWDILEDTLDSYIVVDDIEETMSYVITDSKINISI